jgi:hypothetical protein
MRRIVDAYYSNDLKCWVRLEREADGEWCHTSGYATRADALAVFRGSPQRGGVT